MNSKNLVAGVAFLPNQTHKYMKPSFSHFDSGYSMETLIVAGTDNQTRQQLQLYLQPSFRVLSTACAKEAYCMTLQFMPSLVIAEFSVQGTGDFNLCEQLKNDSNASHIPVILIAENADTETKIQGFNTGADDLIALPVHDQELRARVSNLIVNRRKLRESVKRQIQIESTDSTVQSVEEKFLQRATRAVLDKMSDSRFGVNQFAREVGKSNSQLYRELMALTGQSPNDFIRNIRLQYASELLRKHAGNVSEVANRVGFANLSYFAKCFRDKFNVVPSGFNR
jgi:AraC-like DNA-binding protein